MVPGGVPGGTSPVHLDGVDAAVAAAYGWSADAPTTVAPGVGGAAQRRGGEPASGCRAVRRRLRWSRGFPLKMGGSTMESGLQGSD